MLIPFVLPVQAKDKTKQVVKSVERVLEEDGKGNGGKPDNPGAKGRVNAEINKATNPGKGGGKSNSLEGALLDELIDDDKKGGGKDDKKDGKKGKKGKKKK